jgi:hypothetical protein
MHHRWIVSITLGLALAGLVTPAWAEEPRTWMYAEVEDPMGRGLMKAAGVSSQEPVTFRWLSGGPMYGRLIVRQHASGQMDVRLTLEHAHFLCHSYDESCHVTVRFDDGKPQRFSATKPMDQSTNTLFIRDERQVMAQIKRAKTLRIEALFYQDGLRIFEFNVEGLAWDTPVTSAKKTRQQGNRRNP